VTEVVVMTVAPAGTLTGGLVLCDRQSRKSAACAAEPSPFAPSSRMRGLTRRYASVSWTNPGTGTTAAASSAVGQTRLTSSSRSPMLTAAGLPLTSTPPRTSSAVRAGASAVPGGVLPGGPPVGCGEPVSGGGAGTD